MKEWESDTWNREKVTWSLGKNKTVLTWLAINLLWVSNVPLRRDKKNTFPDRLLNLHISSGMLVRKCSKELPRENQTKKAIFHWGECNIFWTEMMRGLVGWCHALGFHPVRADVRVTNGTQLFTEHLKTNKGFKKHPLFHCFM